MLGDWLRVEREIKSPQHDLQGKLEFFMYEFYYVKAKIVVISKLVI